MRNISALGLAAAIPILLGGLSACKAPKAPPSSEVLAFATSRIWTKSTLTVCWDGEPSSPQLGDLHPYEKELADAVQRAFSAATTGVALTGFYGCDTGPSDVRIAWLHDTTYPALGIASHIGAIDTRGYPSFTGEETKKLFQNIDRPTVVLYTQGLVDSAKASKRGASFLDVARFTVLHELGHIVGLFHEHDHDDSTCSAKQISSTQRFEVFPDVGKDAYLDFGRPFDPYSVMSYCFGTQALGLEGAYEIDASIDVQQLPAPSQLGLSAGDRSVLSMLYGGAP